MSLRCPTVALLYFTFNESPFCDVAQTSDCGISFKALYVVSLRRPTVAFLLKALYVVSLRRPTVALLVIYFINFNATLLLKFFK